MEPDAFQRWTRTLEGTTWRIFWRQLSIHPKWLGAK
jgi:hypothetical protein